MAARCTALLTNGSAATAEERVPPFAVECSVVGDDAWVLLHAQPMPSAEEIGNDGRGAVRAALPFAVPVEAPPARVSEQLAGQQLVDGGVVKRWPTKQKQQAAATLGLGARQTGTGNSRGQSLLRNTKPLHLDHSPPDRVSPHE